MKYSKKIILISIVFQFILMSSLQVISSENELKTLSDVKSELSKKSYNSEKTINSLISIILKSKDDKIINDLFSIILENKDDLVKQEVLEKIGSENSKKVIEVATTVLLKNKADDSISFQSFEILDEMIIDSSKRSK